MIKKRVLSLSWKFPFARLVASREPVILLYHGVPTGHHTAAIDSEVFEEHIDFLRSHFEIVHPERPLSHRAARDKIRLLLTFDDGYRNNAEVVAPILRRHGIPALFFVSSRHATPGRYLWFTYLRALESDFPHNGFFFRDRYIDMSSDKRHVSVTRLRQFLLDLKPHPHAMYQVIEEELPRLEDFVDPEKLASACAGMTSEHVAQLAADPLFSLGIHTADHPFLSKCEPEECVRQILDNKNWLEDISNRRCATIAYPSGDYNSEVLGHCRNLGLVQGHAVIPHTRSYPPLELARIGIYSSSLDVLGIKVQWGNRLRQLGVRFG